MFIKLASTVRYLRSKPGFLGVFDFAVKIRIFNSISKNFWLWEKYYFLNSIVFPRGVSKIKQNVLISKLIVFLRTLYLVIK